MYRAVLPLQVMYTGGALIACAQPAQVGGMFLPPAVTHGMDSPAGSSQISDEDTAEASGSDTDLADNFIELFSAAAHVPEHDKAPRNAAARAHVSCA